jgi:general L-amino acid transport system permease protein
MSRPLPRNHAPVRGWLVQIAVLALIAVLLLAIGNTTLENLDRLGVQSGFDFLEKRAGFDINQTLFAYSADSPVYMAFAMAICNTLLLAHLSIALATLLGFVVAMFRLSGDWFFNTLGQAFIEVFRNIPALLQIFFWYYVVLRALPSSAESWHLGHIIINNRGMFLPSVHWAGGALEWHIPQLQTFGYVADWVITPELAALILGLSLYNASSVAEVIRAGFVAVPKHQWEAARSLGLSAPAVLRHVIVPQALRVIIPPLTTCYLNIFKATSLGAAIGYPEIVSVMVGTTNNIVGRPVEIMFLTFSVYSVVSLGGIWLMARLNRRYNQFSLVQG